MRNVLKYFTCVGVALLVTASVATAQNLLVNPGFEDPPLSVGLPPSGWGAFGNVFAEGLNPPAGFIPANGAGLCSMFGNFSGGFNVSGIFQEFPAAPESAWRLESKSRYWGGDPMTGIGNASCTPNCTDNWVVQKIAFFDAANTEIGAVESVILDGTFAPDVWHVNAPIIGYAPAGTVKVQGLILYLQPLFAGGAAHVDDVALYQSGTVETKESTWGSVKALYR